jgi:hypothetical protein
MINFGHDPVTGYQNKYMKRARKGVVTLNKIAGTVDGLVVTVKDLSEMLGYVVEHMATKDDIAEIRKEMGTGLFGLQTQLNSVEAEIREMKQARLEPRVADLEEKLFGRTRS